MDGGDVAWSSSNNNIARVSNTGVVTAVAPGNCVITASCAGLTSTCNVTVESNVVQSNSIEAEFKSTNSWKDWSSSYFYVQYNLSVKNISNSTLSTWSFDLELPAGSRYDSGWNANVTNVTGSTYRVQGTRSLAPGQSQTDIGMTLVVPQASYIPIPTNIQP